MRRLATGDRRISPPRCHIASLAFPVQSLTEVIKNCALSVSRKGPAFTQPRLSEINNMLHDPRNDLPEWKRILLRAHEEIERRGWCQGTCMNHMGEVCLQGAIALAMGYTMSADSYGTLDEKAADSLMGQFHVLLPRLFPDATIRPFSLSSWNDWPSRTKNDVLRLLHDTVARGTGTGTVTATPDTVVHDEVAELEPVA
jgi:hypothetical protein